jgi:hypothetical protein
MTWPKMWPDVDGHGSAWDRILTESNSRHPDSVTKLLSTWDCIIGVRGLLTDSVFGVFYPSCHSQRVAKVVVSRHDDWRLIGSCGTGSDAETW